MAIHHCNAKIISRSSGRSAVGASAYRAGEKLQNERDGIIHDYTKKGGIVHTEIMLCDNAPQEYQDREKLWNAVERIERDSDSQLARELDVSLPVELNRQEQIELVRAYVKDNFTSQGMCADIAIHDKQDGNPHAHIMLTMRPIDENGQWEKKTEKLYICKNQDGEERPMSASELKQRKENGETWEKELPYYKDGNGKSKPVYLTKHEKETENQWEKYERVKGKNDPKKTKDDMKNPLCEKWDNVESLVQWRKDLADKINLELERKGLPQRVDHRSYEEQGIDKTPTKHMGVTASQMEQKGIETDRGNIQREIKEANRKVQELKAEIQQVKYQIQGVHQDTLWNKIHENNRSFEERAKKFADNQPEQERILQAIEKQKEFVKKASAVDYHKGETYDFGEKQIPYMEYHIYKFNLDTEYLKRAIEKNLEILEKHGQEKAQEQPKPTEKQQSIGGDPSQRTEPPTKPQGIEQEPKAYDISSVARQLAAHRAEFVRAHQVAHDPNPYHENPIYRQRAAQIKDCVDSIKEQGETIAKMETKKDSLGMFKGKEKKDLQRQIDQMKDAQKMQYDRLAALGVADPSQAQQAIEQNQQKAMQEKEKTQAYTEERKTAVQQMKQAKANYAELMQTVPADQVQAIKDEIGRENKGQEGKKSIYAHKAEIEAVKELDPIGAEKEQKQQEKIHTQGRGSR